MVDKTAQCRVRPAQEQVAARAVTITSENFILFSSPREQADSPSSMSFVRQFFQMFDDPIRFIEPHYDAFFLPVLCRSTRFRYSAAGSLIEPNAKKHTP
jgi:hypothetical protein